MEKEIFIAGGDTAKPRNLRKRVALIVNHYRGNKHTKFLDCGCGGGDYVSALSKHGWNAFGIDFLEQKIQQARKNGFGPKQIFQGDLQKLSFEAHSFDVLLFNEVLEHILNDGLALHEAFRVLKNGGHLFVFSPNRLYPFESHGVYLKGTQRKLPVWIPFLPWIPLFIGNRFFHYWARNYWPRELQSMVKDSGFHLIKTFIVWQTFEGISGDASFQLRTFRPLLRLISGILERIPGLNRFGVSQFIHAMKVERDTL